jgi:hypothetical protein
MYTISVLLASSGEIYFSRSAWRKVRDSSQVCLWRRKEAAVGDLLLPGDEYQPCKREKKGDFKKYNKTNLHLK